MLLSTSFYRLLNVSYLPICLLVKKPHFFPGQFLRFLSRLPKFRLLGAYVGIGKKFEEIGLRL
jgi:hypothetical protein